MPTTTQGITYPLGTAAPNVPADLQTLAESIETTKTFSPPRVRAYQSSATTTLTTGVTGAIGMDTEDYDTDGFHSTSTNNSRFTVPTGLGGFYQIMAELTFASNATGYRLVNIRINGSTFLCGHRVSASSASTTLLQVFWEGNLAAGDYVELTGVQSSGGNLASVVGTDNTWLSMRWICP